MDSLNNKYPGHKRPELERLENHLDLMQSRMNDFAMCLLAQIEQNPQKALFIKTSLEDGNTQLSIGLSKPNTELSKARIIVGLADNKVTDVKLDFGNKNLGSEKINSPKTHESISEFIGSNKKIQQVLGYKTKMTTPQSASRNSEQALNELSQPVAIEDSCK